MGTSSSSTAKSPTSTGGSTGVSILANSYPIGTILTDEQEVDLTIQVVVYGLVGCILEGGSNFSLFTFFDNKVDSKKNKKGIYTVETQWYAIDVFFEFLTALSKFIVAVFGIQFYWLRLEQYGRSYFFYSPTRWMDYAFIGILFLGFGTYMYRVVFAILNTQLYLPLGQKYLDIQFYDVIEFTERVDITDNNRFLTAFNYMFQFVAGPKKISLLTDIIYMFAFFYSAQWGPFAFIAIPFIPQCILEFIIYPLYPHLDVPFIPFDVWLQGDDGLKWNFESLNPLIQPVN